MPRTVRNTKIDTRSARSRVPSRREPHWTVITRGCALGYRKGAKGGTWVARFRDDLGKHHYEALGAADDAMEADDETVLSYDQAYRKAQAWFQRAARGFEDAADNRRDLTVAGALGEYLEWLERHGKGADRARYAVEAFIKPALGDIRLAKLSKRRIEKWHEDIAKTPARLRTRSDKEQKYRKEGDDPDRQRRRRSTANRILTILKAALNRAYQDGQVTSDEAWRRVKPFAGVDGTRVRYLTDKECERLVNAASEPFRNLVIAGLLTGCRYGELAELRVADFNSDAPSLHVRVSKSGKPRHVVLTDEGKRFFERAIAGKPGDGRIFTREGGASWGRSHQSRPMREACTNAKIKPAIGFHILRHTYASRLTMSGAPLPVVAAQLGHADTRMVEKHYGHLAPSYVADTVRQSFGDMGLVTGDNVVTLAS